MEFSIVPLTGGAYIEGIGNLYEFDCGSVSGWMYRVNGEFPKISPVDVPDAVVKASYEIDLNKISKYEIQG